MNDHSDDAPLLPGLKPVLELLASEPQRVDLVFCKKGLHGPEAREVQNLCRQNGVRFSLVDGAALDRLCRGPRQGRDAVAHQGVVARLAVTGFCGLEELLAAVPDAPLQRLVEELTPAVADEVLPELALPEVQTYLLKKLLPQIREHMAEGLVGDIRSARVGRSGVIIRNLDTNAEMLRPDVNSLPDVQSFLAEISSQIRQAPSLNPQSRRAINILLSATLPASLTLNREATQKRGAAVVATVEPVYYQIQKGELVLRKGERVSREQQIKLQTLYKSASDPMRWSTAGGAFLCTLLLSVGFFVAPSGKPGTPLRCKDMLLIALLLFLFGVGAKSVYLLGLRMDSVSLLNSFAP